MQRGFLQGEASRPFTPATVLWVDAASGTSCRLGELGMFAWSKSPRIPAFQCESCGVIEVPPVGDDASGPGDGPSR